MKLFIIHFFLALTENISVHTHYKLFTLTIIILKSDIRVNKSEYLITEILILWPLVNFNVLHNQLYVANGHKGSRVIFQDKRLVSRPFCFSVKVAWADTQGKGWFFCVYISGVFKIYWNWSRVCQNKNKQWIKHSIFTKPKMCSKRIKTEVAFSRFVRLYGLGFKHLFLVS